MICAELRSLHQETGNVKHRKESRSACEMEKHTAAPQAVAASTRNGATGRLRPGLTDLRQISTFPETDATSTTTTTVTHPCGGSAAYLEVWPDVYASLLCTT